MNRLVPSTVIINSRKRKSVSDGNANGFNRGRRELTSILFTISFLSSRASLNQASCDGIGQQMSFIIGKFELASFFVSLLAHLHKLLGCKRLERGGVMLLLHLQVIWRLL